MKWIHELVKPHIEGLLMVRLGNWVHVIDVETGEGDWSWLPAGITFTPRSRATREFLEMTKAMEEPPSELLRHYVRCGYLQHCTNWKHKSSGMCADCWEVVRRKRGAFSEEAKSGKPPAETLSESPAR